MNPYCTESQFLQMYDMRTMKGLSGDQNSSQGQSVNIQFLLDLQAGELDTYLDGRVTIPNPMPAIPASGSVSLVSVPVDNTTVTLSDGILTKTFTFLSGGTGSNQVNTASANTQTIAGILAFVIFNSGLNVVTASQGYSAYIVNKTAGIGGNVAITTSTTAAVIAGMSGGGSRCPSILTKWVAVTTAIRLFARRNDRPKQLDADEEWSKAWIKDFMAHAVSIPEIPTTALPILQDSTFPSGESEFDLVYGTFPSPFGPINTTGNIGRP